MTQLTQMQAKLLARIEERKAQKAAENGAAPSVILPSTVLKAAEPFPDWSEFSSAIPKVEEGYARTDTDIKIDQKIAGLDILTAYRRYIHKMEPQVSGAQTEGIKISCPTPGHRDKNPSAWCNTENNTWFCGGCQTGGDQLDLAAIGLGYELGGYKQGAAYPEFRRRLAQDLGLSLELTPGLGWVAWTEPTEAEYLAKVAGQVVPDREPAVPQDIQPSLDFSVAPEADPEHITYRGEDADVESVPWREIIPEGTFISEYMHATCVDDVPEEYHFWHAVIAVGLVPGRNVILKDSIPVFSNIFVCLMGKTGIGKSKSKAYIASILAEVAPYDNLAPLGSTGVKMVPTPGSAESLIRSFQHPIRGNPTNPTQVTDYAEVRGLAEFSEFKGLVQRKTRSGSVLEEVLFDFYDSKARITADSITRGTIQANMPHMSALSTVQPEVLSSILTDTDIASGFLNRWLFVGGPRKQKTVFSTVEINLLRSTALLKEIKDWSRTRRRVKVTPEVAVKFQADWDTFIQHDFETKAGFERIELTIKKLLLLFAINEKTETVTMDMYERVMKMYKYLLSYSNQRTNEITNNTFLEYEELCIKALRELGKPASGREIVRKILYTKRESAERTNRACEALVKSGAMDTVKSAVSSKGGRPTVKFVLPEWTDHDAQ